MLKTTLVEIDAKIDEALREVEVELKSLPIQQGAVLGNRPRMLRAVREHILAASVLYRKIK